LLYTDMEATQIQVNTTFSILDLVTVSKKGKSKTTLKVFKGEVHTTSPFFLFCLVLITLMIFFDKKTIPIHVRGDIVVINNQT